jgi:NAD(P)-dependent dehydrogenase (short-subunit alcohol dehydrogenase family)
MSRPDRPLALVTGASRGIGLAIARAIAPSHALLLVARDASTLETEAAALREQAAGDVTVHPCDLGEPASRRELTAVARERGVLVLVNNAGIAHSAPIDRTDDETWESTMAINLTAPFELARALVPGMVTARWGRIVNVASTAALKGYRYTAAYSASKAGLVGLTRSLALDLARKGVTVNAVCPGFTDTSIVADAVDNIVRKTGQDAAQARASLETFNPQGRLMSATEVAALVAYLISADAAGITGQALAIDGGETA